MAIPNLSDKKILVVEDDDMSFLYLNQLFLLTKAFVQREKTGTGALTEFKNGSYDLVLMDIQLPDMDGKQVTREIRKFNTEVPIIAQTASRTIDERDVIMLSGCTDVLSKPFSMNEIFSLIEKYLSLNNS
jgi:DNA-binding response OmpR family regulator